MPMRTLHPALDLSTFDALCSQQAVLADYPLARAIRSNIVCYHGDDLRRALETPDSTVAAQQELARVLHAGPGVFAITAAYADLAVIGRANQTFEALLEQQAGQQAADHFAQAGANGRIWNLLEKSALHDPHGFVGYYKNPLLQLVSEAWLGPHYQITAQLNVVRPGGQAQAPHRDYHLGFQEQAELLRFPPHVHAMSTLLTLQGAVAHTDMPLESGPTLLLPFSQQYAEGYLAWRDPDFKAYFAAHAVQLPLQQGDAIFFNPALFHAAGSNSTQHIHRSANLLQVSSAFGKPMEFVDRYRMVAALYPALQDALDQLTEAELSAVLHACCDSYPFPTNLDTNPPLYGMAPQTLLQLTRQALAEGMGTETFRKALREHQSKRG